MFTFRVSRSDLLQIVASGDLHKVECVVSNMTLIETDAEGNTALHIAIQKDFFDIAMTLLPAYQLVNKKNNLGKTPLHLAVETNAYTLCNYLLNYNAYLDAQDCKGASPLTLAAQLGHIPLVCLFMQKGANPNLVDFEGCTPLMHAARLGNTQIAVELMNRGGHLQATDFLGKNALHHALQFNQEEAVQTLAIRGLFIPLTENNCSELLEKIFCGDLDSLAKFILFRQVYECHRKGDEFQNLVENEKKRRAEKNKTTILPNDQLTLHQITNLERVWKGKNNKIPTFEPIGEKEQGAFLGAHYKKLSAKPETIKGAVWLGKAGFYQDCALTSSSTYSIRPIINSDPLNAKLGGDFYSYFSNNFLVPKLRLAELNLENSYNQKNELLRFFKKQIDPEGKLPTPIKTLYIMSKWIKNLTPLRKSEILDEGKSVSFETFIRLHGRPPEALYVNGKEYPLIGLMEILAIARLIADTNPLGNAFTNIGFIIESGEAICIKLDSGCAFNFRKPENKIRKASMPEEFRLEDDIIAVEDLRDIQYQHLPGDILWKNLTDTQKKIYLSKLQETAHSLSDKEVLNILLKRETSFNLNKHVVLSEKMTDEMRKNLLQSIEVQQKIYKEELLHLTPLIQKRNVVLYPKNPISSIPENYVDTLTTAAGQSKAYAQYFLGILYERGEGVDKNLNKALHYYTLSANQGYSFAKLASQRLEQQGITLIKQKAETLSSSPSIASTSNENIHEQKKRIAITNSSEYLPLLLAVVNDDVPKIKELVEAGANINLDIYGTTPLMRASKKGNIAAVKILLELGANVAYENKYGDTALKRATSSNSFEAMKILIEYGADIETVYDSPNTVLHYAASVGAIDLIKLMVQRGAKINDSIDTNYVSNFPLERAVKNGQIEAIKTLVELGATLPSSRFSKFTSSSRPTFSFSNIFSIEQENIKAILTLTELFNGILELSVSSNSFIESIEEGNTDALNLIKKLGKQPEALEAASSMGKIGAIHHLMKLGAQVSSSVVNSAIYNGQIEAVKTLVRWGADINRETSFNETLPLVLAARMLSHSSRYSNQIKPDTRDQVVMIKALVALGANVNLESSKGITPLMEAAATGAVDAIIALVELGATIAYTNKSGTSAIMQALQFRQIEAFNTLVELGACKNSTKEQIDHALTVAAKNENIGVIAKLIDLGGDIKKAYEFPNSILKFAASIGDIEMVHSMIECGADINHKGTNGNSALRIAVQNNQIETIKTLVKLGANLHLDDDATSFSFNYNDQPILLEVAEQNKIEIAKILVELGANPNKGSGRLGDTPLMIAAKSGHRDTIKILMDLGADPNQGNSSGKTPLMEAAASNQIETIKTLVALKANIDQEDINGASALAYAVTSGRLEAIKTLVELGADLERENQKEDSHNIFAVWSISFPKYNSSSTLLEIVKVLVDLGIGLDPEQQKQNVKVLKPKIANELLICGIKMNSIEIVITSVELGANLECSYMYGYGFTTPLISAIKENNIEMITSLIELGADTDGPLSNISNQILWSSEEEAVKSTKLLVKMGANVDSTNRNGETALMNAASSGRVKQMKALVELGANVHCTNRNGETPLLKLSQFGSQNFQQASPNMKIEGYKMLVEHGANINDKDNNGVTPLLQASMNGSLEEMQVLIDLGADVNCRNVNNESPLLIIAKKRNFPLLKSMMTFRDSVPFDDQSIEDAIAYARSKHIREIADYLEGVLKHRKSTNSPT